MSADTGAHTMTALDEKALEKAREAAKEVRIEGVRVRLTDEYLGAMLAAGISAFIAALPDGLTDTQIKHMVDHFLGWRLPENFNPDGGISFKATFNEHTAHPMKHDPLGTNLFDAQQAEAMVRYMVKGLPAASTAYLTVLPQSPPAESKAEGFVMVPVVVWDAQLGFIRLYATQLRQDGYETPDGRNLLANRLDGVAEYLSSAAAPSDKVVKVESMGKAKE